MSGFPILKIQDTFFNFKRAAVVYFHVFLLGVPYQVLGQVHLLYRIRAKIARNSAHSAQRASTSSGLSIEKLQDTLSGLFYSNCFCFLLMLDV
jgi:hypothetical protein